MPRADHHRTHRNQAATPRDLDARTAAAHGQPAGEA